MILINESSGTHHIVRCHEFKISKLMPKKLHMNKENVEHALLFQELSINLLLNFRKH